RTFYPAPYFFRSVCHYDGSGHSGERATGEACMAPSDAALWLKKFAEKISISELDLRDTLDSLDKASGKGVQGGRIYDFVHVLAAEKAGVDAILTRDTGDFAALTAR